MSTSSVNAPDDSSACQYQQKTSNIPTNILHIIMMHIIVRDKMLIIKIMELLS